MTHSIKLLFITACLSTLNGWAATDKAASRWIRYPVISPDGQSIAFSHSGQLWLVNATGGEATPLTSGEFYSTRPVWSPDGKSIAFASKRNGNFDVLVTNVNGSAPRCLTHHSADDIAAGRDAQLEASIDDLLNNLR